jgi:hypothetical protein
VFWEQGPNYYLRFVQTWVILNAALVTMTMFDIFDHLHVDAIAKTKAFHVLNHFINKLIYFCFIHLITFLLIQARASSALTVGNKVHCAEGGVLSRA